MSDKQYIGDSVYAEVESGMIKLTTENGLGASNTIFLEDEVYEELVQYVTMMRAKFAAIREQNNDKHSG